MVKGVYDGHRSGIPLKAVLSWKSSSVDYVPLNGEGGENLPNLDNRSGHLRQASRSTSRRNLLDEPPASSPVLGVAEQCNQGQALSVWETAKLSLEFCMLWVSHSCNLVQIHRLTRGYYSSL